MKAKNLFPAFFLPLLAGCAAAAAQPAASPATPPPAIEETYTEILPSDAMWSYYATEGAPKGDWKKGVGTAGWEEGKLPIGYGQLGLATIVTALEKPATKFPVVYLRKRFKIASGVQGTEFKFGMRCDDGCIAYLNGKEIGRLRIKPNPAETYRAEYHETRALNMSIPMGELKRGTNILAVEVYQAHANSSDANFESRAIVE